MDRETLEKQKDYGGEKKPSMTRRMVEHDYTDRRMYMLTMVTEGRRPLFGKVVGKSDALQDSPDAPRCELSELGKTVNNEWQGIPKYYPEIKVLALQMMPDHLHGILFVTRKMEVHLGQVIKGFKTGCNRHYRRLILGAPPVKYVVHPVKYVATESQHTEQTAPRPKRDRSKDNRHHGLLFQPNYCDKILLRRGQLDIWLNYLNDNPRRLLMKREHPDLFRVQRNIVIAGISFSAIGNLFLAQRPVRLQVQCSRSMTDIDIETYKTKMLSAARRGAVLVSPSISKGEKAVMRAAFEEHLPIILLQENGFADLAKPGGQRMEACAKGVFLILAPWEHHNEQIAIKRKQCLDLNDMAQRICNEL